MESKMAIACIWKLGRTMAEIHVLLLLLCISFHGYNTAEVAGMFANRMYIFIICIQ